MQRHRAPSTMDRRVVRSHRLRNRSGRARQGDGRRPGRSALAGGGAAMKRALLALAVSLLAGGSTLAEEDVAAFFHGKTLRLVVGVGVGSGYDINARLLARHLAAHIPGQPTIVVQNQPGAGSLTMTNALYHTGPFDGTVMGASFNGMPTTPLLQPTGVRFDPVKLNWLGSTNRETQAMYVWHTAPAQVLEDTRSKEIVMGAQAPGSTQFDYPVLANVPLFLDRAQSDAERAALRLMLARLEYGRPFFLPPNVPAPRLEALRRAFDATMKDPAYLAEADKLKIDVEPLSGEQVAALFELVARTPAETVARVRAAMETR